MKILCTLNLTGTKMGQLGALIKAGKAPAESSILRIFRRPDNGYDPQAMSVHYDGGESPAETGITSPQVGWIPAKEIEDRARKEVLFNIMAHGANLSAVVTQFDPATRFVRCDIVLADEEGRPIE